MPVKDNFSVQSIDNFQTHDWILKKHYARRLPSISYAFGLYDNNKYLVGIVTFGRPMAAPLIESAFGGCFQQTFLELNRLVVNEGLTKNALSFFVSQALKLLPKPHVVVSYADTEQQHHGYIYQATNWIYTGLTEVRYDVTVKGYEHLHATTILEKVGRMDELPENTDRIALLKQKFGADNVYHKARSQKHRYFYLLGSKRAIKEMRQKLAYSIHPYPKGINGRYVADYKPAIQTTLF